MLVKLNSINETFNSSFRLSLCHINSLSNSIQHSASCHSLQDLLLLFLLNQPRRNNANMPTVTLMHPPPTHPSAISMREVVSFLELRAQFKSLTASQAVSARDMIDIALPDMNLAAQTISFYFSQLVDAAIGSVPDPTTTPVTTTSAQARCSRECIDFLSRDENVASLGVAVVGPARMAGPDGRAVIDMFRTNLVPAFEKLIRRSPSQSVMNRLKRLSTSSASSIRSLLSDSGQATSAENEDTAVKRLEAVVTHNAAVLQNLILLQLDMVALCARLSIPVQEMAELIKAYM